MPTGKDHVYPSDRRPNTYIAVLYDKFGTCVLFHVEGSKISLPRVASPEIPHRGHHMSDCFSRAIEKLVSVSYDLNFLYAGINETHRRHLWGPWRAQFECIGPIDANSGDPMNPSIPGYKWLNLGKLRISVCVDHSLELASDHDYLGFNNAFRIDCSFQEDHLRPWKVSGWHARTTKVAVSVLKNLGFSVASSFEQHQICPTSAVLRTETDKGRVYLKASTRREAAVVQCVSSFAPYLVRKPLYVNKKDEWFLMDDYGETLSRKFSQQDFKCILELHGKLQVESKKHVAELVSAGIPRQGIESIYKRALAMLQDAKICKLLGGIEIFAPVDEEGKIESKVYCKAILQLLNRVYEEGKAPIGVVHGDVYDDNIVKVAENQGEYIIYDWGSARIDVPFSDVMRLETEVVCGDENKCEPVGIDSYLALWKGYGSILALRDMCRLVYAKDRLVDLIEIYEYGKRHPVKSILTDKETTYLGKLLNDVRERMVEGRWPESHGACSC